MPTVRIAPSLWSLLVLLLFSSPAVHTQDQPTTTTEQSSTTQTEPQVQQKIEPIELYRELFKQKRVAHKEAVKALLKIDKYEKQYKLVKTIVEEIFKTLSKAKLTLQEVQFSPGDPFPEDESVKEAFSNVAENTALFGDITMRLPDISHDILNRNREWELTVHWGVGFCNDSNVFVGNDARLLSLMAQELGVIPKQKDFVNPYTQEEKIKKKVDEVVEEILAKSGAKTKKAAAKEQQRKEKKKKMRGPRLSGGHTEL